MRVCIDVGGALTGEHGVGYEKQRFMPWLYNEADLENMERVRAAFGNTGRFNPCKILPHGTGCGEMVHQEAAMRAAGPDAYV
jgi:glycolate oxidase